MKRLLCFFTMFFLIFALSGVAVAAVVVSPQTVYVNNIKTDFEVYNIDGNNYFKLRDIALSLNNTKSQFSVAYDASVKIITVTTGKPYIADGSELQAGADQSATARKSNQRLMVDGSVAALSAYNIGGNNFFQLRELAQVIGFSVTFNGQDNSVLINSAGATPAASDSTAFAELATFLQENGEYKDELREYVLNLSFEGGLFFPSYDIDEDIIYLGIVYDEPPWAYFVFLALDRSASAPYYYKFFERSDFDGDDLLDDYYTWCEGYITDPQTFSPDSRLYFTNSNASGSTYMDFYQEKAAAMLSQVLVCAEFFYLTYELDGSIRDFGFDAVAQIAAEYF